jgi:hemoglobin-like flavoprotein
VGGKRIRNDTGGARKSAQYGLVGQALLDTLAKGLGKEFTPEVKAAWVETYGLVASVMKNADA